MATFEYTHPSYTTIQQCCLNYVQGGAEDTNVGVFRSRHKCVVTHIIVTLTSLPSAGTTFSMMAIRNAATTVYTSTASSFSVLGNALTAEIFTLTTLNTLLSATETMSVRTDTVDKGKFDLVYEYSLLP